MGQVVAVIGVTAAVLSGSAAVISSVSKLITSLSRNSGHNPTFDDIAVAQNMRQAEEKRAIDAELAEMEARVREAEENERMAIENANNAELAREAAEREANEGFAKAETEKEEALRAVEAVKEDVDEVKKKWEMGVEPEYMPTLEDLETAKRRHQYREGAIHLAVAGSTGTGKSSLINALRGVKNSDRRAARVGIVETTTAVGRYPDPIHDFIIWYDVPGAGTLTTPAWEYFKKQELYVFDAIIILFSGRFSSTDIAILKSCQELPHPIPTYIVRSQSLTHISNLMRDEMDDDGSDDDAAGEDCFQAALEKYVEQTHKSVHHNLQEANIPQTNQKVYFVDSITMRDIVRNTTVSKLKDFFSGSRSKKVIDEMQLLHDILEDAEERRHVFDEIC